MTVDIINLRDARQFLPEVADRNWRAWWQPNGYPLAAAENELDAIMSAAKFPFNLVAHIDGVFAGTVSAVATDLDERPELTPWVASLWVEPNFRGTGIARDLVEQATATMFAQGFSQVYLYAVPKLQALYIGLGWRLLEERYGKLGVDIFVRKAPRIGHPVNSVAQA